MGRFRLLFRIFSIFSTFILFIRRLSYITSRMKKIKKGDLNILIFELQCDYMRILKYINYLRYEKFIEIKKICRDLTHFIFKCSIANYLIN